MAEAPKKKRRWWLTVLPAVFVVAAVGYAFYVAMEDRDGRMKVASATVKARNLQDAIGAYFARSQVLPEDNAAAKLPDKVSEPYFDAWDKRSQLEYGVKVRDGILTVTFGPDQQPVAGKTLVFLPAVSATGLVWGCEGGTVEPRYRLPSCRPRP